MKIICTLTEYARLIRGCQHCMESGDCGCCTLDKICSEQYLEDAVEFEIVDDFKIEIEEIDLEDSEELDLEEITIERNE